MPTSSILIQNTLAGGSAAISRTQTYDVDTVDDVRVVIPAGATVKEVDLVVTIAQLKTLCIVAEDTVDQTVPNSATSNLTVKTNSSGMPDQTLTLKPYKAGVWDYDSPFGNPITDDITKLYVANPNTVPMLLKVSVGRNIGV